MLPQEVKLNQTKKIAINRESPSKSSLDSAIYREVQTSCSVELVSPGKPRMAGRNTRMGGSAQGEGGGSVRCEREKIESI